MATERAVAHLAGFLVLLTGLGVWAMPAPSMCHQHPNLHPSLAKGLPTLTPPHPHLKISVRLESYSSGYEGDNKQYGVRLIPAYVESERCVNFEEKVNSSAYTLCYTHTDISLPTRTHNLLGVGKRLVELTHHFRRSSADGLKDPLVVGVVSTCYPAGSHTTHPMLHRGLINDLRRLLTGQMHTITFDLDDFFPSPDVPYYQYRAGHGEQCELADWLVYERKVAVTCTFVDALKTYYNHHQTDTTTATNTTTTVLFTDSTIPLLYSMWDEPSKHDETEEELMDASEYTSDDLPVRAHPPSNEIKLSPSDVVSAADSYASDETRPDSEVQLGYDSATATYDTLPAATDTDQIWGVSSLTTSMFPAIVTATTSFSFPRHPRQADEDYTTSTATNTSDLSVSTTTTTTNTTEIEAVIHTTSTSPDEVYATTTDSSITTTTSAPSTTTTPVSESTSIIPTSTDYSEEITTTTDYSTTTEKILPQKLVSETTTTTTTTASTASHQNSNATAEPQIGTTTTDNTNSTNTPGTTITEETTTDTPATTTEAPNSAARGGVHVVAIAVMLLLVMSS